MSLKEIRFVYVEWFQPAQDEGQVVGSVEKCDETWGSIKMWGMN